VLSTELQLVKVEKARLNAGFDALYGSKKKGGMFL
jgi:hypothetical protein